MKILKVLASDAKTDKKLKEVKVFLDKLKENTAYKAAVNSKAALMSNEDKLELVETTVRAAYEKSLELEEKGTTAQTRVFEAEVMKSGIIDILEEGESFSDY